MQRFARTVLPVLVLMTGCGGDELVPQGRVTRWPVGVSRASAIITESALRQTVTAIASDEMMGREPGTEGDELARTYLAGRLRAAGFEPAFGPEEWEQPIKMVGVTTRLPARWTIRGSGEEAVSLVLREEFIGGAGVQQPSATIDEAELVFVGYGIVAPEEEWDDFKGVDLGGKVLLMLNDDPDWDPDLFAGERRLYYGRWTYKYEIAAARGAAGAIIIHTDLSAGYPWAVVLNGWSGEQFELPAGDESRLQVKMWVTEEAAGRVVDMAGYDLDHLVEAAKARDFEPVPLGLTTSLEMAVEVRDTATANVGGVLRGSDPVLAEELVIVSAHHDHLGIGEPDESGDRIYNGALDNGAAMAQALSLADALAALAEPPRRSVMVLFPAAEEQGLLGSRYFTDHPTVPPGRIVANINFELGNIWGRTRDVTIFGRGKSTLEDLLAGLAEEQGRYVTEESTPRSGWYYRSDQFSFARIGVPAIWFKSGTEFVDRQAGWGESQYADWIQNSYHRPSDEMDEWWNFVGMVEDARLGFLLALSVAESDTSPRWYPGDEFEDERLAALSE